ncbi:hypothetical protein K437DRAFT_221032 [Tilletiaria anomala UBC 951]|uniref:Structural maintenance of chromosomes protein n=1 Tax=Tilletiaria anomala (strain ATCC 24038 / CBS 436.72 / UBC 951) TaxID=1037660 RepID=A0A066WE59_TILAU|nr:uncharacterized protein K437DRAFT_221032 [Tilletiaria anomala UBC 951]KDN52242.1 hypothetical protein K437DRAFT_221032 [Tilletiaria anomala UBC 951]
MDAISFVLGVKSGQLRSSQLKDLIYRGRRLGTEEVDGESDLSDPDHEARSEESGKRASVTAVFRDGKAIEHRFQRTIHLSGSSEYRINGKSISYAQYNSKLEQYNILVKAKNFLVFQGDVEAVASQNSKDLSKLVDRISGSLDLQDEYDQAKAAMEKAVDNSTFNFNKRRGINSELKQFKEQKTEAERYEQLLDEKDAHVLQQILWKLYHLQQNMTTQLETIGEVSEKLDELREAHGVEEHGVISAKKDVAKVQKDMIKQEKAMKRAETELADKQPELDAVETRLAYSRRTAENAESLIERIKVDLVKHGAAVEKLQKDRDLAQAAADHAAEERRLAAQKEGVTLSEGDLAEYQELKATAEARAISERQQLDSITRQIRTRQEALRNVNDQLRQLHSQKEHLEQEREQQQTRLDLSSARINTVEANLRDVRSDAEAVQRERERIRKREAEVNGILTECYNKLLQAGHDRKESEKEAKMRETIMTLQKIFPGVRGRVIDLCEPTQQKYAAAISTVLGRNADSIVVEYEKTAIDCIEYLRNQRVGQATFIPLDTIQIKPMNDRLRSIAKGARLAFDIVKYQPNVQRAIQHACGNALVCDDMTVARYVVYERKQEVKAVTLDGTVIHKSGLITGGQSGQSPTRRWEEREMQGLHRQREQCISELKDLQKEKRNIGSDDDIIAKIGHFEAELAAVRDEHRATSGKLQGAKDELKVVDAQIKEIEPKIAGEQIAAEKAESKATRLRSKVEQEEDQVFSAFCARIRVANIREYEQEQLRILEDQNEAKLQYATQLKRLTHQLNFETQTVTSIEERIKALQKAHMREERKMEEAASEREKIEAEMVTLRSNMKSASDTLQELQKTYDSAREVYTGAKRQLHQATKALDAALRQIASCNDTIEKLGAERAMLYRRCRLEDIDLPLVKGSLTKVPLLEAPNADSMELDEDSTEAAEVDNFGIEVSFKDLEEEEMEDGSAVMAQTLQERIDNIVSEIERMTPNLKATERLDDTETRLAETEQEFERSRRDAKVTRDEFLRVKKRRCELFNKAYEHISERIDPIYKELTKGKAAANGGTAYLSLEDTEEPYLSGIKYHAMPPMKRFRDMDQLSGGERTMAALALLFAIHSYQPAPFFVLDEVDAALDSQNVAKVSNYIRQHASDAFQFIVISLKASLYERSQALVGIYRDQDLNSSSTLTLDLEKYA